MSEVKEIEKVVEETEVEVVEENKIVSFVKEHKWKFIVGGVVAGGIALLGGIYSALAKIVDGGYYDYEPYGSDDYTTVGDDPIEVETTTEVEITSENE